MWVSAAMTHRLLADAVVLVHFAFILFAVLGGLLTIRWRWIPWVHLPAAIWGGFVELTGRMCPLTPLENWLRQAAGASVYRSGFIEHYLVPVIYPSGLTRGHQAVLAALLLSVNVAVYALLWWRARRSGAAPSGR